MGLDPNPPMKDSGVEWLGEVPEHWGVVQEFEWLFRERDERSEDGANEGAASDGFSDLHSVRSDHRYCLRTAT